MNKKTFWICLTLFCLIYLSLRVFWLNGDPGIPSVWEYGYNATDEGYYLDGGKEKFLWNYFVDLSRTESFTYGFSAGTHWLSYLAHLAFGLSTWTWRIPFFLITCVAWLASFCFLSKKSDAVSALLLSVPISSMPMLVAYERTASNDVLIGSLTVIAYVLAAGGRGRWRVFAAAIVTGLIVLIKPSVWILMPIVCAGVLQTPKFKKWWIDVLCFMVTAVLGVFACKLLAALAVLPDAHRAGVGIWEIVRRTTTHYPLPSIFAFASHFKGLSAFPRDPSYAMMGVSTVFVFVLPIAMALRNICTGRFNGNTLLFISIPTYVVAINVMNTQYTHYFIPALMFMPIVMGATSSELAQAKGNDMEPLKKLLVKLGLTLALCTIGILLLMGFSVPPQVAQQYYSKIYNFPLKNVWGMSAPIICLFVLTTTLVLTAFHGLTHIRKYLPVWIVSSFFAASAVFAALPSILLAPHLHQETALYFAPMCVVLVSASLVLVLVFSCKGLAPNRRVIATFAFISFSLCYVATPNWRNAAAELLSAPTHYHATAAKELATLLPSDAIVIGERSNQMLMSVPVRTATTFAANSDPIPVIKSILAQSPSTKLYALADSQHAYNLKHYRDHEKEYHLRLLKTFKMPSFATGKLVDVYLCQIEPAMTKRAPL